MNTADIQALNDRHVLNTYGARRIALVRGEGVRVWDADGREYLDLFAGIAVCNLGHCHPGVSDAICQQARTLMHVSNLYYIEPQARLAEQLCLHSFADRWFFCNSGAEANEAAIKMARRYWAQQGQDKPGVIAAHQSFHGRTLAALAATGQPKYHDGFAPLPGPFKHVPYGDLGALAEALDANIGAVLLEPVQGEGGVRPAPEGYLQGARQLCDQHNALLIFDEVQCGMGRTGHLFAHEGYGVTPDIVTLAKALGNGIPIGAMGCTEVLSGGLTPGTHASTFGGNPLSTAAALAVVEALTAPGFLAHVREIAHYFMERLEGLKAEDARMVEVRGRGLMIGIEFTEPVAPVVGALLDQGILCGPAGPNVLRFVPPLILQHEHVDRAIAALSAALQQTKAGVTA